jgi:hypothetical protein
MKSAHGTPALTVFVQFICLSVAFGLPVFGQGDGRFYDAKRQATDYLDSGQYDRAAARFEEVWEKDQSDPYVAEGLAIAYLNGEDRRYHTELEAKAQRLVLEAIRLGGTATFLVQHSHEKFNGLKPPNDYCSGKLSIKAGKLVFVAQARKASRRIPSTRPEGSASQPLVKTAPSKLKPIWGTSSCSREPGTRKTPI